MLRKPLGGRGREWATESLRLLETMQDLDDSAHFRTPLDPLKYPEYYNTIANPIDLSKVMLKFHGGSYLTLEHFAKDMRQMFENYKKFFCDPNTEMYSEIHRLSWWFEAEYERIKQKWGKDGIPRSYTRSCPILPKNSTESCTKRCQLTRAGHGLGRKRTTLDERIRMLRECNRVTENATKTTLANSVTSNNASAEDANTNIILSIKHGTCTIVPHKEDADKSSSLMNSSPLQRTDSPASPVGSSPQGPVNTECPGTRGPGHCRKRGRGGPNDPGPPQRIPRFMVNQRSPPFFHQGAHLGMMLKLDTNNIWFGSSRYKPKDHITLTEEGFQIPIRHNEQDVVFSIKSEAIIRCAANFSRARKHTLFLFVLPSCTVELQRLFGNEFSTSNNMIVLFLRPLTQPEISQLIHIFWNMSKTNMFGQLFSEVDQGSALALLANIKPAILKRLPETLRNGPPRRYPGRECHMPWPYHAGAARGQCDGDGNGDTEKGCGSNARRGYGGMRPQPSVYSSMAPPMMYQGMISNPPPIPNLPAFGQYNDAYGGHHMPGYSKLDAHGSPRDVADGKASGSSEAGHTKADDTDALIDDFGGVEEENGKNVNSSDLSNVDKTLDIIDDGSDLEIVIPSDSEEDEKPGQQESPSHKSEDDIVMTSEKISIRCPITQQIMKYPVKNRNCGHCYDRQGVEGIIKHRGEKARCPVPGCSSQIPLSSKDMLYDYPLWNHIQSKLNPGDPKFNPHKS